MVSAGIGITLIPETAIDYKNLIKNSSLIYLPFVEPAPARKVGLMYRATSTRKICFKKLANLIQLITKKEFPNNEKIEVLPVKK